jgi:Cof subfamily protein (haloacid dehalogenase superfamily)
MSIKLIALDMDGTSVTPDKNAPHLEFITKPVLQAIQEAQRKGIIVIFATGRWFNAVKHHFPITNFTGPQIFCNGAVICDPDGRILSKTAIPENDYKDLMNSMLMRDMTVGVCDEYSMARRVVGENIMGFHRWFDERENLLDTPFAAKITALEGGDWLADLIAGQFPHLQTAGHKDRYMEIWSRAISKGIALNLVAEYYGFGMDEVLAIGDGDNDYDMLERAGIGIAMGQADDTVKACADDIAPSLEHDGVAWAIEKYALK